VTTKYEVVISPRAEDAIRSAFRYIAERAPMNAERWLHGLYSSISTLETFPKRCSLARENEYFDEELRQLIYKSHRVVFYIEEDIRIVRVVYFLHAKQRAVGEPIQPLCEDE
jgi:plasmid stabilization system protein ParE